MDLSESDVLNTCLQMYLFICNTVISGPCMYEDTRCVAETRDSLRAEHFDLRGTRQSRREARISVAAFSSLPGPVVFTNEHKDVPGRGSVGCRFEVDLVSQRRVSTKTAGCVGI